MVRLQLMIREAAESESEAFNPTMVRLQLRRQAGQLGGDRSFNPTMVRLQPYCAVWACHS